MEPLSVGKSGALGAMNTNGGSWLLKALIAPGEGFSRPPIWRGAG
jgi:hypothetical protein